MTPLNTWSGSLGKILSAKLIKEQIFQSRTKLEKRWEKMFKTLRGGGRQKIKIIKHFKQPSFWLNTSVKQSPMNH